MTVHELSQVIAASSAAVTRKTQTSRAASPHVSLNFYCGRGYTSIFRSVLAATTSTYCLYAFARGRVGTA